MTSESFVFIDGQTFLLKLAIASFVRVPLKHPPPVHFDGNIHLCRWGKFYSHLCSRIANANTLNVDWIFIFTTEYYTSELTVVRNCVLVWHVEDVSDETVPQSIIHTWLDESFHFNIIFHSSLIFFKKDIFKQRIQIKFDFLIDLK